MGANAQTVVPTFTAGQVLTAGQLNQSARTGVPVFATTTDRDAAFGGAGEKTLAEGQVCFIEAAPKRLQVYNGTAWRDFDLAYQAFTPTFTNFTVGNGTVNASYARLGQFVHYVGSVQLGSTSSMSTNPQLSLPVNADNYTISNPNMAIGFCNDASPANYYPIIMYYISATTIQIAVQDVSTWVKGTFVSATAPFTWTTSDSFHWNCVYRSV